VEEKEKSGRMERDRRVMVGIVLHMYGNVIVNFYL
jgi:hypothetical protein